MLKNVGKMDLKELLGDLGPFEPKVTVCLYLTKKTKDDLVKLAEKLIPGKRRGKLSMLAQLIFSKVLDKNKG